MEKKLLWNFFLGLGSDEKCDADGIDELDPLHHNNPLTPDSSQTESDDVSPQIQRKRRLRENVPRFSISADDEL